MLIVLQPFVLSLYVIITLCHLRSSLLEMHYFDFWFMIFRCVNEKCDEFWMNSSERLMKIVPF